MKFIDSDTLHLYKLAIIPLQFSCVLMMCTDIKLKPVHAIAWLFIERRMPIVVFIEHETFTRYIFLFLEKLE
jgi:hypothetical protein